MRAAGERIEHPLRLGGSPACRDLAAADDGRVDAEHRPVAPSTERAFPPHARSRVAAGSSPRSRARRPRTGSQAARGSRAAAARSTRGGAAARAETLTACGPSRSPRPASFRPSRRHVVVVRVRLRVVRGWSSIRRSTPNPFARSSPIQSPCAEMELDSLVVGPVEPVHPELRAVRAPRSPTSCLGRASRGSTSGELRRKTSCRPAAAAAPPPGSSATDRPRSRRRTPRARGRARVREPAALGAASTSGNSSPISPASGAPSRAARA